MAQKPVLGKGLASLFPASSFSGLPPSPPPSQGVPGSPVPSGNSSASSPLPVESEGDLDSTATHSDSSGRMRHLGISMASVDEVFANHFQPRREFDDPSLLELAQSIKTSGIIQPLVVRKNSSRDGFELIAGERRLRAAKIAGLKQVPIVIRKSTDREALELALIENIQRQNLNCIDEALAYFQLIQDFSLTQEEVSERVGKDRATISNYLRLLRLPEEIIEDLKTQVLSFGHGKALLGLEDAEMRLRARLQVIDKRLSVRETEALVDSMKRSLVQSLQKDATEGGKANPLLDRFNNLSKDLATYWSAKVEVKGNENRGKIVIHYSSRQELDRLIEEMQTNRL